MRLCITDNITEAIGHKYVNEVTTPPTYTTEGVLTYTCQNDETHKYTESIAVLDFSIKEPSEKEIRCKDGIVLHVNVEGGIPKGAKIVWTADNEKFTTEEIDEDSLQIISNNKGYTIFTATLVDADGNVLATDSIEMYSKAGFFDKIGGFFRSIFKTTKIYEN